MRTPSFASAALLLPLIGVAACSGDDTATSDTATTTATTGATATATATTTSSGSESAGETTSGTSTTTGTTGVSATAGDCADGAEQCKRGAHQVCEAGEWVDSPCADGEFCFCLAQAGYSCSGYCVRDGAWVVREAP